MGHLRPVARLVRSSHERYDGRGYPDGLVGDAIPFRSRILLVCDVYDAMTSDRPYRSALSPGEALGELHRCAGSQFDPLVVEAFAAELATVPQALALEEPPSAADPGRTALPAATSHCDPVIADEMH
jgi:HD-GYP domain-containing protein (c-di-GMP phosphodiesterase class II)